MQLTRPLTTDELRQAGAATRDRYLRVLRLVHENFAPWPLAVLAIEDADMQPTAPTPDAGSLSSI